MAPRKRKTAAEEKEKNARAYCPRIGADQLLEGVLEVLLEEHRGLRIGRTRLWMGNGVKGRGVKRHQCGGKGRIHLLIEN